MSEPVRDQRPPHRFDARLLLLWSAIALLAMSAIAVACGIGVWASHWTHREALEAVEITAIAALAVLMFVHNHPPTNPPRQRGV